MIFTNFYKIPSQFIDFGDNVVVDTNNFFVEVELEFKTTEISNAYLNIEAISKNNKYFDNMHQDKEEETGDKGDEMIYTILDENEEEIQRKKSEEVLEEGNKEKIDQLLENFEEVDSSGEENKSEEEEEEEDDDDYFKKLESQVD